MKQQIVPTSPKSPHMQEKQAQKEAKAAMIQSGSTTHATFFAIVFSILFGTISGFLGFAFAWGVPTDWPVIGRLNVISFLESQKTSVLLSSGSRQSASSALDVPRVLNQVVPVFAAEPIVGESNRPVADAVVVTSDGWLAVPTPAITPQNESSETLVVVLADDSVEPVIDRIDDAVTNMSLLRIDRDDLSPVAFAQNSEYTAGDSVSVIQSGIGAFSVRELPISSIAGQGIIRKTDIASYRYIIENGGDALTLGSAAYTADGRLIGIIDHNQLLLPAIFIENMVEQLQDDVEVIERSAMNIEYINISHITDAEKERLDLPEMGLYLYAVQDINEAVESDPEQVFMTGDSIISWNGQLVDESDDLAVLVHDITPGDTVRAEVVREGNVVVVEVEM